jgi:hypothetical protein
MATHLGMTAPGVAEPLVPELLAGLIERAARPDFARFQAQLRSSGYCARPVRLQGHIGTCGGGGRRRVWSTDSEPDGILRKACGNRREAVCPSCAERYRQDAYHLIAAGLRGGKGVPDAVTAHPAVFVTLTAPSFGFAHTRSVGLDGRPRRCRPRRDAPTCEHGVRLSCGQLHADDDPRLGEPLCPDCFDHTGAVAWNNTLSELWRRTTIYLPRVMARHVDLTQQRLRELVRASYVKVAEYQRPGLVHLHVVIRLDRAMPVYRADEIHPPTARFSVELLERAMRTTAAEVYAPLPDELGGGVVRWGDELDVRRLDGQERRRVAGYLAKYATKSTEHVGGLLHSIDRDQVDAVPVRDHVRRYLHAAFTLDDACHAAAEQRAVTTSAPPRQAPGPESAADPNALAWRALRATSQRERVRVRLHNGSEHTGRITRWAPTHTHAELTLDSGETIAIADVKVMATAQPPPRRDHHDRRFAACAHQLGYRGHCLTKSRRYSTTFAALRQAREQHVHAQLLAHSTDPAPRALAGEDERVRSFRYVGQGHLTAADALLAASAAARAREQRWAAREQFDWEAEMGRKE